MSDAASGAPTAEKKAALFGQLSSVSGRGTESVRAAYGESGVYDLYSAKYYADLAGDKSGTVTGKEAQAYLDRQAFQKAYKAALFAAMCPNVKKNPYE